MNRYLDVAPEVQEAIRVMTSLVEQYGYYSEGETFTICDADEAWIMKAYPRHFCPYRVPMANSVPFPSCGD